MKSTGIVRKIDELGRIVIPKELRKNLNIKDGEDLEIFVENELIVLKKHNKIMNMKDKSINIVILFQKYLKGTIILADREKIIYSIDETLSNKNLSNKIIELQEERKKINCLETTIFELTKEYSKNTKYLFYPIIINTDLLGSLMLLTTENAIENEIVLFNILCTLIKYELEN